MFKNYGTWSEFAKEGLDEMEQAAIDAHCESVMMEQEEAQAKAISKLYPKKD